MMQFNVPAPCFHVRESGTAVPSVDNTAQRPHERALRIMGTRRVLHGFRCYPKSPGAV